MRKNTRAVADVPDINVVVPVNKGGFGAGSNVAIAKGLGVLLTSDVSKKIARIKSDGTIDHDVAGPDFSKPILKGPTYLTAGMPFEYRLVNPKPEGQNAISIDKGGVSLVGQFIKGQAPTSTAVAKLTVNSREILIPVKDPVPLAPVLTCARDGKAMFGVYLPVAISGLTTVGYKDALASTEYQVSDSKTFDRILYKKTTGAGVISTRLAITLRSTQLWVRARVKGNVGVASEWSNSVTVSVPSRSTPNAIFSVITNAYQSLAYGIETSGLVAGGDTATALYRSADHKTCAMTSILVVDGEVTSKTSVNVQATSIYQGSHAITADGKLLIDQWQSSTQSFIRVRNNDVTSANFGQVLSNTMVYNANLFATEIFCSDDGLTVIIRTSQVTFPSATWAGVVLVYSRNPTTHAMTLLQTVGSSNASFPINTTTGFGHAFGISGDGLTLVAGSNNPGNTQSYNFLYRRATQSAQFAYVGMIVDGSMLQQNPSLNYDGSILHSSFVIGNFDTPTRAALLSYYITYAPVFTVAGGGLLFTDNPYKYLHLGNHYKDAHFWISMNANGSAMQAYAFEDSQLNYTPLAEYAPVSVVGTAGAALHQRPVRFSGGKVVAGLSVSGHIIVYF